MNVEMRRTFLLSSRRAKLACNKYSLTLQTQDFIDMHSLTHEAANVLRFNKLPAGLLTHPTFARLPNNLIVSDIMRQCFAKRIHSSGTVRDFHSIPF